MTLFLTVGLVVLAIILIIRHQNKPMFEKKNNKNIN